MLKKRNDVQKLIVCLIDIIPVLVSAYIAMMYRYSDMRTSDIAVLALIHVVSFYMSNIYSHFNRRGYLEEFRFVSRYSIMNIVLISVIIFATKGRFFVSRTGVVIFTAFNTFAVYLTHLLIRHFRRHSRNIKQVLLITTKEGFASVKARMQRRQLWEDVVTAIAVLDEQSSEQYHLNGQVVPRLSATEIEEYATQNVVDEAFIYLPAQYDQEALSYVYMFERMGIDVSLYISLFSLPVSTARRVQKLLGFNVVTFSTKFYNEFYVVIKRLIDIIGALVGLAICGLVGIFIVPLIVLESPGSPIFAHNRVGKNGRIFKFYKFRSMYTDAEERKKELMAKNEMDGHMFKMENDPRITKVGKFIRNTSLDELPQFFNVLRGDMSLVGTRPPTEDEYRCYSAQHKRRLSSTPGITGLWQVSGRNEIRDFDEVVRLDVEYIENWSLWLDFKIILKTVKVVFARRGAK